ncbi:MAG: pirin family protein [Bacteroidota bacterium]|nr:pirin family protein [Bacteroidota bacterium]MDP4193550.1 pirin family protein [Bacteroidota bacterium]
MRTIKEIHRSEYAPIDDLVTYSPLPSRTVEQIDPFLFLNHHGPQHYKAHNNGLPFGPHPHRGMETVTFILEGDTMHKDSSGHISIITKGGIQWMTAGKGIIHAEVSSDEFKEKGGLLEILQLWINLPSKLKMTEPKYFGFQKEQIPSVNLDEGKVKVNVISGYWDGRKGVMTPLTPVQLNTIEFHSRGKLRTKVPLEENIFLYIVRGKIRVNDKEAEALHLVEFNNDGEEIEIEALSESYIIFGHALPFNEPVVAHGPFVMNSMEEIQTAYNDFKEGKFGQWKHS